MGIEEGETPGIVFALAAVLGLALLYYIVFERGSGPRATAKHILVPSKEQAQDLAAQLSRVPTDSLDETFASLAKRHSTCPSKHRGGSLGTFAQGAMVPPFDKAVFENDVGKVLGPIETSFGFHLILVSEKLGMPGDNKTKAG